MIDFIKEILFNNNIYIDKSIYMTVVIGHISMYGIWLAFFQFLASLKNDSQVVCKYLGRELREHFLMKNTKTFKWLLCKKLIWLYFVIIIMYKPCLFILERIISDKVINVGILIWYILTIVYLLFFAYSVCECAFVLNKINDLYKEEMIQQLIDEITSSHIKNMGKIITANDLCREMKTLFNSLATDKDTRLYKDYCKIIVFILEEYLKSRKKEFDSICKSKKYIENQDKWFVNSNTEFIIFRLLANNEIINDTKGFAFFLCKQHLELVKLDCSIYIKEGYKYINGNHMYNDEKKYIYKWNGNDWFYIIKTVWRTLDDNEKRKLLLCLQDVNEFDNDLYMEYCNECITHLIYENLYAFFEDALGVENFIYVFEDILKNEKYNTYFLNLLSECFKQYNKKDMEILFEHLNKKNMKKFLCYIILYFSIYKYVYNWDKINLKVLKIICENIENINEEREEIIEYILNSDIGHRFTNQMYDKLIEYINSPFEGGVLNDVYQDNMVNVFYITIIKACVLKEIFYAKDISIDTCVYIIGELERHDELMGSKEINILIYHMRHECLENLDIVPFELSRSFRRLVLADVKVTKAIFEEKTMILNDDVIGKYVLTKVKRNSRKRDFYKFNDLIWRAYANSNLCLDEYIDNLNEECRACGFELTYEQRTNMRNYLKKI